MKCIRVFNGWYIELEIFVSGHVHPCWKSISVKLFGSSSRRVSLYLKKIVPNMDVVCIWHNGTNDRFFMNTKGYSVMLYELHWLLRVEWDKEINVWTVKDFEETVVAYSKVLITYNVSKNFISIMFNIWIMLPACLSVVHQFSQLGNLAILWH